MKYYELGERIPRADKNALGIPHGIVVGPRGGMMTWGKRRIKGKRTGDKRAPRAGEWYLSGAIPQAWRAPNDLGTEFHILKLVIVREVLTYVEDVQPSLD